MFHSGVKHDDLIRSNRLGVCVSPAATVTMQKKMNEQLEGKVQIWKASIWLQSSNLQFGRFWLSSRIFGYDRII